MASSKVLASNGSAAGVAGGVGAAVVDVVALSAVAGGVVLGLSAGLSVTVSEGLSVEAVSAANTLDCANNPAASVPCMNARRLIILLCPSQCCRPLYQWVAIKNAIGEMVLMVALFGSVF